MKANKGIGYIINTGSCTVILVQIHAHAIDAHFTIIQQAIIVRIVPNAISKTVWSERERIYRRLHIGNRFIIGEGVGWDGIGICTRQSARNRNDHGAGTKAKVKDTARQLNCGISRRSRQGTAAVINRSRRRPARYFQAGWKIIYKT